MRPPPQDNSAMTMVKVSSFSATVSLRALIDLTAIASSFADHGKSLQRTR